MKNYQVGDKVDVHKYSHGRYPNPELVATVTVERLTRSHAHLSDGYGCIPIYRLRHTPQSDKRGNLSFAPHTQDHSGNLQPRGKSYRSK